MGKKIAKTAVKIVFSCLVAVALAVYISVVISGVTNGHVPYWPSELLWTYRTYGIDKNVFIILLIFSSLIIFKMYLDTRSSDDEADNYLNYDHSGSDVYGSADWLKPEEIKQVACLSPAKDADGAILGQLDKKGKKVVSSSTRTGKGALNRHIATFGSSGSGKSRCFVRNLIFQSVKNKESMIITDPSGELYDTMAPYLKDHGYVVKVLNMVSPEHSNGWNCLKEIGTDEQKASIFSDVVIANTGDKGDVWANAAKLLLKALLLRTVLDPEYQGTDCMNMPFALDPLWNPLGEDYMDLQFQNVIDDLIPAVRSYEGFKRASKNMSGNIVVGLITRISILQNKPVAKLVSTDDIDLLLPGKEKCAYFCVMPMQHDAMKFIASLFFRFLFMDLSDYAESLPGDKTLPVKVNFIMDEFPNIGFIPGFDSEVAIVRKYGININVIFQSLPQLQDMYPTAWATILSNCDTLMCIGCNDETTAKYLSNRSGESTVKVRTKKSGAAGLDPSESSGDGKRMVLTPHEAQTMGADDCLIVFRGRNMLKAHKFDYTLHPEAKHLRTTTLYEIPSFFDEEARAEYDRKEEERVSKYRHIHPEEFPEMEPEPVKPETTGKDSAEKVEKLVDPEKAEEAVKEEVHTPVAVSSTDLEDIDLTEFTGFNPFEEVEGDLPPM